jgi:hypothetical protein
MYKPKTIYTQIALHTISHFLTNGNLKNLSIPDIPDSLLNNRFGCFVSLHKQDGELRGCIGTIEPFHQNLYEEIINNAVAAISRDTRFKPLSLDELDTIELSVDVLTVPEEIYDYDKLDIQIYGVIVSDGKYKRGILLPNLEGIESIEHQIQIAKRKAGLKDVPLAQLKIYRFTSTRYH